MALRKSVERTWIDFMGGCGLEWLSFRNFNFDQGPEDRLELHLSLERTCLAILELDPSFIESSEHLDPRNGILHALGFKEVNPGVPWDCFHPDWTTQDPG